MPVLHSAPGREEKPQAPEEDRKGLFTALAAFGIWGTLPLYWNLFADMPPFVLLCHRILWSAVIVCAAVGLSGRMPRFKALLRQRRMVLLLCTSAVLISVNWFLFIYAVSQQRVLDSSLGYYINPLVNTLIGCLLFRERFSRLQGFGIGLAALGVLWNLLTYGSLPVLSLAMAVSFSLYGTVRKLTPVDPLCAVLLETLVTTPVALFVLGQSFVIHGPPSGSTLLLLILAGPFTLLPLLLFGYAAQRVRLTTIGLCQYVSPTLSFIISIFVLHEPFSVSLLVTFLCIWAGLAVFTWSSWRALHPRRA